jgi:hypothetical protein
MIILLFKRYHAIKSIYDKIENKLTLEDGDLAEVGKAVLTCKKNDPEWPVRSFLQQLTDVLSLGLIPLYRWFCSKEKKFQEELMICQEGLTCR